MSDTNPSLRELLEKQHTFPGPYTFKFIGKAADDFAGRVIAVVRAALGAAEDPPHVVRPSAQGGHVSITLTPVVSTPDEILAVYERVGKVDGLLVSL